MNKKKLIRYVLILAIIGAVSAGVIGYYMYNKPHRNIEKAKPDLIVTADELAKIYENEEEGNERALNRVILLEGNIDNLKRDAAGNLNIEFSTEFGDVDASLDERYREEDDYMKKAEALQAGDHVKLQCYCSGAIKDTMLGIITSRVVLKNCFIKNENDDKAK